MCTLDETGLYFYPFTYRTTHTLDFLRPVLVEFFTAELEIVHLVVYFLAPVFYVCLLGDKQMLRCGDV